MGLEEEKVRSANEENRRRDEELGMKYSVGRRAPQMLPRQL
jgi:hypothetical protein